MRTQNQFTGQSRSLNQSIGRLHYADFELFSQSCGQSDQSVTEVEKVKMKSNNLFHCKPKLLMFRSLLLLLLLFAGAGSALAQGPYPNQGDQTVCLTGIPEPYGVIPTLGSTYTWTVDNGTTSPNWTLNSNGTNLATILWRTPGTYTVRVVETITATACIGAIVPINVTVNPLPVVALTGPSPVCLNSTGNVYTTDASMTNYVWNVVGGAITAGGNATSNTVTITWNGTGPYSVSVNYTNPNGCVATNPTVLPVTINPLPVVALTGPSPVCLNSTGNVYTTD